MVRIKQEQREQVLGQTRQRLLESAAGEFARHGYLGANINTISTNAGFARGTVYNYFPSKHALLIALIDSVASQQFNFIATEVLLEASPDRRLECFFRAGFEVVMQHLNQARVVFTTVYGPDEALKAYCFQAYQPIFEFLSKEILAPGIQQGIFREKDPQSTAMLLMTFYLGAASQVNPQGRLWMEAGQIADFVLNGLRK